ncbi:MAG: hypothetical protein ACKVP5_17665 [Aestuariivirga sp.]
MTAPRSTILLFDEYEGFEPASASMVQILEAQCGALYRISDHASFERAVGAKSTKVCDAILLCDNRHIYPEGYVGGLAARLAECGYSCAGLDGDVFPDLYDGLEDTVCRLGAQEGGLEVNALDIGGMILKPDCREAFTQLPASFFENGWRYASWTLAGRLEAMGHRRWLLKGDDPRKPIRDIPSVSRRVSPPDMVRGIHAFGGMRRLALPPVTA